MSNARTNRSASRYFLVALLVLTGCQLGTSPQPTSSPTAARATEPSLTRSCNEDDVRLLVNAFIDAFNRGDDPGRFFAPAPASPGVVSEMTTRTHFHSYSASGGPPNVAIYERRELAPYFSRRHTAGERLSLVRLVYVPDPTDYPRAGFIIFLNRTAPDIGPRGPVEGKSAINCVEKTILVLTM